MKKRICSLVLCLCLLLALPVFLGAGTQPDEDSGLVLSKSSEYDAETGAVRITLEAYASGKIITQRVSTPCDIALVLDESGSMADSFSDGQTRKAALIAAVNAFLTQIAAENGKLSDDVTPHRVGIIGFSSESGARVIRSLSTGLDAVQDATLNASGGTYINKGFELVDDLFDAGSSAVTGEQRNRVVVAFTDGNPGTGNWNADSTKRCAAEAIQLAAALKAGDVTVYTVGIFDGADPADLTGEANRYMNAMSSNYPNATAAYANSQYSVTLGDRAAEGNYYLSAGNTEALEDIFKEIASQTGGAAVSLDSSAVVLDEISDAFAFPEGADASSISITTRDADYSTGALRWTDSTITGFEPSVTLEDNTVRVTGFDFNHNFVAEQGRAEGNVSQSGDFHGRKLIISFTVLPKNGLLGGDVATNGPDSGVYDADGNRVEAFEVPTVHVPLQPVVPAAADQTLYLGETLDLRTLLPNPDAGLDGVNNTADLTYTIRDGAQTIGTYAVPAGESTGVWVWAADYTADGFQDGVILPQDARKTYTIECTVSSGGKTATAASDAVVMVQTCTLTLQKDGWDTRDEGQSFLFRVRGAGNACAETISLQVAVQENGSVTITGLPVGRYTITEDAGWSWRYAPGAAATAALANGFGQDSATVTIGGSRTVGNWLTGESFAVNRLVTG